MWQILVAPWSSCFININYLCLLARNFRLSNISCIYAVQYIWQIFMMMQSAVRIKNAINAFRNLQKGLWTHHGISIETKLICLQYVCVLLPKWSQKGSPRNYWNYNDNKYSFWMRLRGSDLKCRLLGYVGIITVDIWLVENN